jgi:hypothetical protein
MFCRRVGFLFFDKKTDLIAHRRTQTWLRATIVVPCNDLVTCTAGADVAQRAVGIYLHYFLR